MVGYGNLAADHHFPADAGTASDGRLGHQDRIFTDDHIVGDLNQVIRLDPAFDPGLSQCGPVDRIIGPDFNLVVDLNDSDLRYLDVRGTVAHIAETVTSYRRPCMDDDIVSNQAIMKNGDIGVDEGPVPDVNPVPDKNTRKENSAIPYHGAFPHIDMGMNHDLGPDTAAVMDHGLITDAGRSGRPGRSEQAGNPGKGQHGIRNQYLRTGEQIIGLGYKYGKGFCAFESLFISRVCKKRYLVFRCPIQGIDAGDGDVPARGEFSPEVFGDVFEGITQRKAPFDDDFR